MTSSIPSLKKKLPLIRNFIGLTFLAAMMMACSLSALPPALTGVPATDQSQALPTDVQPTIESQTEAIEVITIPLGLDPHGPYQMLPYFLETGGGHYLLYGIDSKKLIYDGQEVYSGELAGLYRDAMNLSRNGLHYAYVVPSNEGGNFHDLIVDEVKVTTAEYLSSPAVTDDGQHYFYTGCLSATGFTGSCLFKDGQDIYIYPGGILEYSISRNGDAYLASLRDVDSNNTFTEALALNGTIIYQGMELKDRLLSPNGAHYAYVSLDENNSQHLIVDGVDQRSSQALALLQVTDRGSVCSWDAAASQVVINANQIPVTHEQIQCYLTDDTSHYLIRDGGWSLDGKPIQFPGVDPNDKIWRAELTDQGWYVYRLVQ